MKIIPLLYIVALLFTSVAWGAVSDIVVGQRAGTNQRFVQRVVTGTANPLKPVGFGSDGVFGAISQLRGISFRTPDGASNIDLTTNGAVKITAGGTDSIDVSQRRLINSGGDEVFDWQNKTLLDSWRVTGSLRVGSEILTGTPISGTSIDTTVALNTATVSTNTSFTFSTTPPIGQVFGLEVRNSSASAITVFIPASKDAATGATVLRFTVLASPGIRVISWRYDGTDYIVSLGNSSGSSGNEVSSSSTSVTDRIVSFTDTSGRVIKDSGETVASLKARANHTGQQAWNTINGLPTTLAGYGITDGQPLNTNLNSISILSDPNVDRLLFWDDSSGSWRHLTLGTNLSITDTTLNAATGTSGASGSGFPLTGNADFGGFNASNINTVTATSFNGNGSALTNLNAAQLTGSIASPTFTGIVTNTGAIAYPAAAMTANVIDVTKELNTKTISANTTFTFSGTPVVNQWFGLYVKNTSAAIITVTFPISKDSVSGADITTATIAATAGRQHLYWRYDGSEYIIYRGSSSSGGGSGDALLIGGNNWTGNQVVAGNVTANLFTGEGSGLTSLAAAELIGTIPDITTETLTTARSRVVTPTAGVGNVINTSNGETTITLTATTATLSYSPIPATGTRFEYSLIGHTSDCVVNIPATYSYNTGGLRTTFTVPANKLATIWVKKEATRYVMTGDPTYLADLPITTTPSITSLIEVDQGTGSQSATLTDIKKALRLGTKRTGNIASGGFGNTTLDFELSDSYIYYVGGTATHNLPDAAANENCAIVYIFNGNYVITLLPDSNDFIRYGTTTLSDSLGITITGSTGQTAVILSDGANWSTIGGTATFSNIP